MYVYFNVCECMRLCALHTWTCVMAGPSHLAALTGVNSVVVSGGAVSTHPTLQVERGGGELFLPCNRPIHSRRWAGGWGQSICTHTHRVHIHEHTYACTDNTHINKLIAQKTDTHLELLWNNKQMNLLTVKPLCSSWQMSTVPVESHWSLRPLVRHRGRAHVICVPLHLY